jgi:hypothetical protein
MRDELREEASTTGRILERVTADKLSWKWYLGYNNHSSLQDRIQVEINFLMRACALEPRILPATVIANSPPCEFLVLPPRNCSLENSKLWLRIAHLLSRQTLYPPELRARRLILKDFAPSRPSICNLSYQME